MLSKTRVLIVEDDPSFRMALTRLLQRLGFDARAVGTVREGYEQIDAWGPDAAVIDLVLPDDHGAALLHAIRERGLPIKVAIVTGMPDVDDHPEILRLNPDLVLQKPIDIFNLAGWLGPAHRLEP